MRPVSLAATLLLRAWPIPPFLAWAILARLTVYWSTALELQTPVILLFVVLVPPFLYRAIRPLRKWLLLRVLEGMIRSGYFPLMEVGVWRLLLSAHTFWPGSLDLDHIGITTLHRLYETMGQRRKERLLEIIKRIEMTPRCPVAPQARDLLWEIEPAGDRRPL